MTISRDSNDLLDLYPLVIKKWGVASYKSPGLIIGGGSLEITCLRAAARKDNRRTALIHAVEAA